MSGKFPFVNFRDFGSKLCEHFFAPYDEANNISTCFCWRFWLILGCYLASFLCCIRDPYFVSGTRIVLVDLIPFVMAYVIAAAVNWEMQFTGKPAGANLVLQFVLMVPFGLLLACIIGNNPPVESAGANFLGQVLGTLKTMANSLLTALDTWLPRPLLEMFRHPWLLLLLVAVLFALCFRSRSLRLSAIMLMLVVAFLSMLSRENQPSKWFWLGLACFGFGLAMHWCDYRPIGYARNVCLRLKHVEDARFLASILEAIDRMREGKTLNTVHFCQIVCHNYAPNGEYTDDELKLISREICRRMVEDYGLVTIRVNSDGTTLQPDKEILGNNAILAKSTLILRMAAVSLVALAWTLMPLDLIPDAIPVIGVLDDLAIFAFSMFASNDCWKKLSSDN
jgi:hypothetical protein